MVRSTTALSNAKHVGSRIHVFLNSRTGSDNMSVHMKKRERVIKNGRSRKVRPKTFSDETKAKAWAKTNKISSFELVTIRAASSVKKAKIKVVEV